MSSIPVITPWKDLDDLLAVRDLLYPKQVDDDDEVKTRNGKLLGLRIVYTWEKRGHLPHAVLSTAQLTEAIIAVEQLRGQDPNNQHLAIVSPSALTSVLAMAVSQFVTGFCDTPASRYTIRRSMYEVASDIGMPQSWVEVRHEITHGKMPDLQVLRTCAEEGIQWLWNMYWSSLDKRNFLRSSEANDKAMKELVMKLLPVKMEEVKTKKFGSSDEIIKSITASCSSQGDERRLASIFVHENLLMPKRKITEDNVKTAFRFWDGDLQRITQNRSPFWSSLVLEFLETLLKPSNLKPETDTGKMAVYMWMEHLLVSTSWVQITAVADSEALYEQLIDSCLLSPTFWSHKLCMLLLDNGTEHFRREWERQYLASKGDGTLPDEQVSQEMSDDVDAIDAQMGGWKPYQGVWIPKPIGQL